MNIAEILNRKEPLVYLLSPEESRVEAALRQYCETSRPLYRWSYTRGLEKLQGGVMETVRLTEETDPRAQTQSPLVPVLKYLIQQAPDNSLLLLKDVHQFLRSSGAGFSPVVASTVRALRDAFYELRELGKPCKVVLLAPELAVPADLEKEVRIHELPLPTRAELAGTAQNMLRRAQEIRQKDEGFTYQVQSPERLAAAIANAAVGLTQVEAEYLFNNLLYVERRVTDNAPAQVVREKQQIIRKSGVLEFVPPEDLQGLEVGGLDAMMHWLRLRKHVFENRDRAAQEYGLRQPPRGVLLMGISGCGKSLVCKKIAHEWGLPLLRLDMGAIFDRWVGASEERLRKALAVTESIAPCLLWLDEVEKGFSVSTGGDGSVSARVLGTFLVWMQEKKAPVFIAATANDITALPPELLRAGRFDNRFFVGCPGEQARREIFSIHLRARNLSPEQFDLDELADLTFGFTGAEIEQVVLDSAYDAFYENRRATHADLQRNIERSRPLVKSLGRQMERILALLDNGRMELASAETIPIQQLIERLHIQFV